MLCRPSTTTSRANCASLISNIIRAAQKLLRFKVAPPLTGFSDAKDEIRVAAACAAHCFRTQHKHKHTHTLANISKSYCGIDAQACADKTLRFMAQLALSISNDIYTYI